MVRARVRGYVARVVEELRRSFGEEYTPRQIAGSFAVGVFITMLPTLGTGLLLFLVLVYVFEWINKIALFASVLVLNPVVKWGVYAASMILGVAVLGPVNGGVPVTFTTDAGRAILVRLLVGNLILAVIATVIAYAGVHRLAARYQDAMQDAVEAVLEEVVDEDELAGPS